MGRLVKVTEWNALSTDESTIQNYATSFVGEQVEYDEELLEAVVDYYGSNSDIAMELTGATSKKDTAYRTVMRGLQNVRAGKHSPKYENAVRDLALDIPEVSDAILQDTASHMGGTLNVSFTADVQISRIIERRTIHATLSGRQVSHFLETALTDNFDAYNLVASYGDYPHLTDVFGPVEVSFT
jgi:hypothetical protein